MTEQHIFQLKDGRSLLLRLVQKEDWLPMQNYLEQMSQENIFTNQYPGKPRATREQFEHGVENISWMMTAWDQDKLVGAISAHHQDKHIWYNKMCRFGVHLLQAYAHQGLGTHFLDLLEVWAREHQLHRIEGDVRACNLNALSLYLKKGFRIEGCHRENVCINGQFYDEYLIGKLLD